MTEQQKIILKLRGEGLSTNKIIAETGFSKGIVNYVISARFIEAQERKEAKEKADAEFEQLVIKYLPESNSLNNLCSKLGIKGVDGYYQKINKTINKYNLSTNHFGTIKIERKSKNMYTAMSDEEFFVENSNRHGKSIIKRLVDSGYKEYKCENCGISEWDGKSLSLQAHHINGNHNDNRIENIQLLCPNCHSQTDTYARQNKIGSKNKFNVTNRVREILEGKESSFKEKPLIGEIKYISEKEKKYCLKCGKEIKGEGEKYCSHECANEASIKFKASSEELIEDFKELKSYLAVGRKYGVSDKAIKKRVVKYGILEEIQKYIISRKKDLKYKESNSRYDSIV